MEPNKLTDDFQRLLNQNGANIDIKDVLTYGSLICLSFTEEAEKNSDEYYAYSEGLTDTRVLLKTKFDMDSEGTYSRGIFRIYPSFYHDSYTKGKQKFEEITSNTTTSQLDKRSKRTQIPKLMKGIHEELALNVDVYEKLKGTPVQYGQVIQLLHVSSQKYLSYDPNVPADLESDCLKYYFNCKGAAFNHNRIELKYENSEYTCFRVMPGFKYQQESEGYIFNDDVVCLMSTVDVGSKTLGDPYLHASRTVALLNDQAATMEQVEKKEVNISNDKKSMWSIKIFSEYINEKSGALVVGDIIWINLSEEDKNLVVHVNKDNERDYHFRFISCSSSEKYKKFVGNSNGLFTIQSTNIEEGGLVKWDTPYKLKHLTTNKYLAVEQKAGSLIERKNLKGSTLKLVSFEKQATTFSFEMLYSTIGSKDKQFFLKYMPKDAYFRLKTDNNQYMTYWDVPTETLTAHDQDDGDYVTVPFITSIHETSIFHCSRAAQEEYIVTMFLISCKQTIKDTLPCLKPKFMNEQEQGLAQIFLNHKLFSHKFERTRNCLEQLQKFCRNKLLDYLSADQTYGNVNNFIQDVLKEQLFIELLVQTLIYSFPSYRELENLKETETRRKDRNQRKTKEQEIDDYRETPNVTPRLEGGGEDPEEKNYLFEMIDNLNHKKRKICELTYQLITAICDHNNSSKSYVFKYLPLFQMQADYIPGAIDCVNMILKDNEELLLNLHRLNKTQESAALNAGENIKKNLDRSPIKARNHKPTVWAAAANSMVAPNQVQIRVDESVYMEAYKRVYNNIKYCVRSGTDVSQIFQEWNAIQFFACLLQRTDNIQKQKKLLSFFHTITMHEGVGININQEIIYKYFTYNNPTYGSVIGDTLLRITSKDRRTLHVSAKLKPYEGRSYELAKFLENENQDQAISVYMDSNDGDSFDGENQFDPFKTIEGLNQEVLISYIDLCAAFCKSRNFSWKNRLEQEIPWEALMNQLREDISDEVKASISRLMTALYVDQEPRRNIHIPISCKIVTKNKEGTTLITEEMQNVFRDDEILLMKHSNDEEEYDNLKSFKRQFMSQITTLKELISGLPLEITKENVHIYDRQIRDWNKIYNSYILEVLKMVHLMLNFKKIKIDVKKLEMEPLPKKNELNLLNPLNLNLSINLNISKNLNLPFNIFKKKEDKQASEFEDIMKALITLLEYDKTYPEAKKMLNDLRDERKNQEDSGMVKNLFSAKKLLGKLGGFANLAKNLVLKKEQAEKSKNKLISLDFLNKELSSNEIYLKQSDVMKRILENLLGEQEAEIETVIKMKILDILDYYCSYKQDKLFSNVRRVFFKMVEEAELLKLCKENLDHPEVLRQRLEEILSHYMKYILPRIMMTGTAIDKEEQTFKDDEREDILDINEILDFEILPVLLQQLSLNNNKAFEKKVLHLMLRMYNQREQFATSIKGLLLLFDQTDIQNFNQSKKLFRDLQRLTEESESWLTSNVVDMEKLEETKRILIFFCNSIFSMKPTDIDDTDFDPAKLENEPVNKVRQDMYRHLQVYIPVISLIKDNIHILESSQNVNVYDLFRLCFAFLTAFARQNNENQLLLSQSIVVFLYNIHFNLGHIKLLVEIYRDNYTLCTTKLQEVLDSFVQIIVTTGRKAEYLEFFKVIQKVNGKVIYNNQRLVLDTFLDPAYRRTLLYLASPSDMEELQKISKKDQDYRHKYSNIFGFTKAVFNKITKAGDEPYYYHAELIDLLGVTAVGKEGLILNEVRLRSTMTLGYFLELLCEEDHFTSSNEGDEMINEFSSEYFELMKIPIANYLFFVYLESEKVSEEFIKNKHIMKRLVEQEQRRLRDMKYYKDTYVTYLFDHLIQVFYWYYKQGIVGKDEEDKIDDHHDYNELILFVKTLQANLKKFKASKISETGKKNLQDLFNFLFLQVDAKYISRKELPTIESQPNEEVQNVPKELKEADVWKEVWLQFLDVFGESKLLEESIDKEKKIFAKALMSVDTMVKKESVLKDIINKEEVTKKLINFVIDNENTEEVRDTFLLILDALGNIIENEEDEDERIEKQNFLNRNNSVYMIFSKLCDPNLTLQDPLFHKLISFATKLLEGGNSEVQKNIYNHFKNFSNSEVFFIKIQEKFVEETQQLRRIIHDPEEIDEDEIDQIQSILRLLQLFAEGHFSDLQNYIRQQTNSYHSYDLLVSISDLLGVYMEVKHCKFFETMMQCFDTLSELIQGPCMENQLAVVQSNFPDLASNLLSIDERAQEMLNKNQNKGADTGLKKWQLAQLKYKCSITLLSLLEARKDNSNVHRMMKSLPIEVLSRNYIDIFRLFQIQYKGEYKQSIFLHYNHEPEEGGKTEEYCSLIIETGFNLYFLANIFSEAQGSGVQEEIEEEEQEDNKMLKNNIIAKWGELLIGLGKAGFSTVKNVAKNAVEEAQKMTNKMLGGQKEEDEEDELNGEKEEHMMMMKLAQERDEISGKALDFYKKNTAHIEVLREDNHLEKTYFSLPPFCKAVTKETKIKFNRDVNRISAKTKCDYLLKEADKFIEIIKYEYWLMRLFDRVKILSLLTSNVALWKDTSFILAIIINLMVVFSYKRDDGSGLGFDSNLDTEIRAVGSILIVLSMIIVAIFLLNNAPLLIKKAWTGASKDQLRVISWTVRVFRTMTSLLSDFHVLYYMLYGASAVIGVSITPLFFALHLLDVLVRYPTLQNVLKSIYQPRKSLLLTFLLLQIFNYIFSLFGFYVLSSEYQGWCENTWMCFLTAIDKSFKVDGGLGGYLKTHDDIDILRFAFDNLYQLVIMIVLINIVSGLIIDTFGSLRDEEKKLQFDVTNICFICGFDRELLDKASDAKSGGSGFESHIKKDHYLWNYMFYIAYIKDKESTDYTGLESYIAEQIEKEEISWFPTHRALVLKGQKEEEDGMNGLELINVIEERQAELSKATGEMAKNITALEEVVKKTQKKKKEKVRVVGASGGPKDVTPLLKKGEELEKEKKRKQLRASTLLEEELDEINMQKIL